MHQNEYWCSLPKIGFDTARTNIVPLGGRGCILEKSATYSHTLRICERVSKLRCRNIVSASPGNGRVVKRRLIVCIADSGESAMRLKKMKAEAAYKKKGTP